MKVLTLRGFQGAEGHVRRGAVLDVGDQRAAYLIKKGLASEVKMQPRPLSGGPTGEAKPSSSSQAARQPKTSRSKSAAAKRDS